ncbi:MAG: flippase-like domain-containing protein [Anaerolineae bacterium]|nr:flippase-like domain-containing protein [Anaerolineae bacterium]
MKVSKWLVAGVGLIISGVFLWFAFRKLEPEAVWASIQQVNAGWLLVGAVVYFGAVTLISLRWQFLLRAIKLVELRNLIPLVSIGYMGNNVYPFRSGEILRIVLLQHHYRVPIAKATTTVVVERAFDGIVMLTFIAVALLFVEAVSIEVRRVVMFAAPIFLTVVAVFFLLAARPNLLRQLTHFMGRFLPGRLHNIASRLGEDIIGGLEGLRSPKDLAGAVASSYASWMVEALVYWIVSAAFGLQLSYAVMLLVVGVVNLAGLIPASPGQIGVFEFFVSVVLIAVGVAPSQSQAYALVVHLVIWLPVTLVGFFFLIRQGLGWGAITGAHELEKQAAR